MATAIKIVNSKNNIFDGNFISGFETGIEAINSDIILNRNRIQRCNVGLQLRNSDAIIHDGVFTDNAIDIVVDRSKAQLIDTIANMILAVTPKNDYRINPYYIESLAIKVINTRDPLEKRRNYKQLLGYLKNFTYIWAIYGIVKEALRLAGINI